MNASHLDHEHVSFLHLNHEHVTFLTGTSAGQESLDTLFAYLKPIRLFGYVDMLNRMQVTIRNLG